MTRIFVSIASYRDPETPATLRDLFTQAAHPERIFVGVLWQAVPVDDDDCMLVPPDIPTDNVLGIQVHPRDSLGACWARHRILTELRGDQEFVLQIDSHTRFVPGWDVKLLAMWALCCSPRALLSTYPIPYTPPNTLGDPAVAILTAKAFNHRGVLMFLARALPYNLRPCQPLPNPFISAGFLFGPAAAFDEVPYDKYLYFIGEEVSFAVRLWTHGWDVHTPNEVVVYHLYGRSQARPTHWADNPDWKNRDENSLSRIRHLLGVEKSTNPQVVHDLARFGLGAARTLAEYERYADVDLCHQVIGPAAKCGRFAPHPSPASLARQRVFTQIFDDNAWKAWETRSGASSTRQSTNLMVSALAALFEELQIHSLLDAGCGDVNWLAELSASLDMYLGVDVVEHLAIQNTRILGHRAGHFFKTLDITRDALPKTNAILCRHVFSYLSNADIDAAIGQFAKSGTTWLIASTDENIAQNPDAATGTQRPVNLTAAPFHLPEPMHRIHDGQDQWLGIWRLEGAPFSSPAPPTPPAPAQSLPDTSP